MLTALLPFPSAAQTLLGRLVDDATGEPVSGAQVELLTQDDDDALLGRLTGEDGRFTMPVQVGTYRLRARRIGYATTTSIPFAVGGTGEVTVEFRISADAVTLLPLIVTARRVVGEEVFARRIANNPEALFWTPEMVDSLRPTKHVGELFGHTHEIRLRWGWGYREDMTQGPMPGVSPYRGHRCLNWIVDDRLVPDPSGYPVSSVWGVPPLAHLAPDDVVAVEMYRGWWEIPDEIEDQLRFLTEHEERKWARIQRKPCGIAIIWTRDGW